MGKLENNFSESSRCRAFFCSAYPEHFDDIREQILEPLNVYKAFWILHDKDVFENGEPKKPHYHIYIDFENNSNHTTEELARFLKVDNIQFSDYVLNKPVQAVRKDASACENYMLHIGYPGFKYAASEIHYYNCCSSLDTTNFEARFQNLLDWVNDCATNHIQVSIAGFYQQLLNMGFGREIINRSSIFIKLYEGTFKNDKFEFFRH